MSKKNTPATTLPAVQVSEQTMATSISQQYSDLMQTTQDLVRRTIHFGAALAQAEIELEQRGILKNRKAGQGMQGWLAQHCPDVNYKTAMRWKALATQVANSLSCSSDQALKLLTGDNTIEVPSKVSSRLDKVFEATSLRKLTQQLFDFASEGANAGRPSGTGATQPVERLSASQSAQHLWARPLSFLVSNRSALFQAAKLLPIDKARDALSELTQLCDVLKTRLSAK